MRREHLTFFQALFVMIYTSHTCCRFAEHSGSSLRGSKTFTQSLLIRKEPPSVRGTVAAGLAWQGAETQGLDRAHAGSSSEHTWARAPRFSVLRHGSTLCACRDGGRRPRPAQEHQGPGAPPRTPTHTELISELQEFREKVGGGSAGASPGPRVVNSELDSLPAVISQSQ